MSVYTLTLVLTACREGSCFTVCRRNAAPCSETPYFTLTTNCVCQSTSLKIGYSRVVPFVEFWRQMGTPSSLELGTCLAPMTSIFTCHALQLGPCHGSLYPPIILSPRVKKTRILYPPGLTCPRISYPLRYILSPWGIFYASLVYP